MQSLEVQNAIVSAPQPNCRAGDSDDDASAEPHRRLHADVAWSIEDDRHAPG